MRKLVFLILISVFAASAFAGPCSGKCGAKCTPRPDWGYSFQDPHYVPDCAPPALKDFHEVFIPMLEARKSHESAYLRQYAEKLYRYARDVQKTKPCCSDINKKPYKRAAKDLVKDCDRLRDISFGGSDDSVYEHMKQVEEDFVRLANLCE
jgi:hypothetical protein